MTPAFSILIKPHGAICNLDCTYCYYLSRQSLYPGSNFRMDEATLTAVIRQTIAAHPGPEILFAWQGGEPLLMGLDFYARAIAIQQALCPPGKTIANTIQTNGVLITDAWARFFQQHHWLVGVSLDGPAPLHDAYRVNQGGQPTFVQVMNGLRRLQRHGVEFNILTAVHAANQHHPLEVYHFLRDDVGTQFIQFIPIVVPTPSGVTPHSVEATQYGRFLTTIFNEWQQQDIGRIYIQLFDITLGIWLGVPSSLCIFQHTCGDSLIIEHNGDVYACDHFVDPAHHLGNLHTTPLTTHITAPAQHQFGQAKQTTLPRYCRECAVRPFCHGGCPKDRFTTTPHGQPGLNYLCPSYHHFFTHTAPTLRHMAHTIRSQFPIHHSQFTIPN